LPDGLACFCPSTGETHILDAFPAALFELTSPARPISRDELVACISREMGESEGALVGKVAEVLEQLAALGMIQPWEQ